MYTMHYNCNIPFSATLLIRGLGNVVLITIKYSGPSIISRPQVSGRLDYLD